MPALHPPQNKCEECLLTQPVSATQCSRTDPAERSVVWGPLQSGGPGQATCGLSSAVTGSALSVGLRSVSVGNLGTAQHLR